MTEGLEEVQRMAHEYGSDLALVVNHSGGKDSTRMLGFVRKKFQETPTCVVTATPDSSMYPQSLPPTLHEHGAQSLVSS